jgi:serine/threonine protein kinase
MREIIQRGWSPNPSDRISFDGIFAHLRTIDFRVTANVDVSRVGDFVACVVQEEATPEMQSIARDLRLSGLIVDASQFKTMKQLGQGTFAELFSATDPRSGRLVAVKILKESLMDDGEDSATLFRREVEVLASVDHETLLGLRGYVPLGAGHPAIVTDLMEGGSLQGVIDAERNKHIPPRWDAVQKLIVLYGIAIGMTILHKNGIIHRDLKPANVLLNERLEPKVADFGQSKFIDTVKATQQTAGRGTPAYMAPEMFTGEDYDVSVDVFAYAIIVYTVMTGNIPYEKAGIKTIAGLAQKVLGGYRPEIPASVDPSWRALIAQCWDNSPYARPKFSEICDHLAGADFMGKLDPVQVTRFLEYKKKVCPTDLDV